MCNHWNQFVRQQSNEKAFVEQIHPMLPDNCGKKLFIYLWGWYSRRSNTSKYQYYILTWFLYGLSSLIPVLTALKGIWFKENEYDTLAGIAVLCTFASGLLLTIYNTLRPSENWRRFRGCAESLKAEACKYIVGLDEYKDKSTTETQQVIEQAKEQAREQAFIKKMLEITSAEKDQWLIEVKEKAKLTEEEIAKLVKNITEKPQTDEPDMSM